MIFDTFVFMIDKRLQVFCAVAETLSFSEAARITGISQPAVSKHIAQIEEEIGSALFIRVGRSVILTEKGSKLHSIARNILDQYKLIDNLR